MPFTRAAAIADHNRIIVFSTHDVQHHKVDPPEIHLSGGGTLVTLEDAGLSTRSDAIRKIVEQVTNSDKKKPKS